MIKFHPKSSTLANFVEGTLPSVNSLIISAHCDMCPSCLDKIDELTQVAANGVFSNDIVESVTHRDYISMFECITREQSLVKTSIVETRNQFIEVDGRKFSLPKSLARLTGRIGEWSRLVGKLWLAPVDVGGPFLMQLLYMEKGGYVPEHTHKGNEISLVLSGQFDDGSYQYSSGDYIALNQIHTHTPVSISDGGCLVVVCLDKPLQFTKGWANLMNPLSQLYFKVNTH